jgi:AcrR family transcriptional regulator
LGRKPKEQQGDTKAIILDAAMELFAEKGFDGTGMHDIAKMAGITYSVTYYHFKNKNEILETLYDQFLHYGIEGDKEVYDEILDDQKKRDVAKTIDDWLKDNEDFVDK